MRATPARIGRVLVATAEMPPTLHYDVVGIANLTGFRRGVTEEAHAGVIGRVRHPGRPRSAEREKISKIRSSGGMLF